MKYVYLFLALLFLYTPLSNAQWTNTNGPDGGYVIHISGDESTLFGSTGSMIYQSTDKGSVWSKIDLAATKIYVTSNLVYAQHATLGGFVSSDGGNTFELIEDGIPAYNYFPFITVARDSIFGIAGDKVFQLDPTAKRWNAKGSATYGNTLSGTSSELFALGFGSVKSLSPSGTFSTYGTGFPAAEFPTFAFEIGNSMIVTTSAGAWKSGADSVWTKIFTNIGGFNTLVEHDGAVMGISYGKLMTSPDSGSTWAEVSVESELKPSLNYPNLYKIGATLYAAGIQIPIKSEDGGLNWTKTGIEGLKNPILSGIFAIDDLVFATSSAAPGGNGGFGVYKSTDNGLTWELKTEGLVSTRVFRVRKIGANLYAATVDGLHVSTDEGETWAQIASTKGNTISDVFAVDENKMIIAGSKIWTTTDGGETLTETTLQATLTASLPMIHNITGRLFYGIYMSEDAGDTWIATPKFNNTSRGADVVFDDQAYSFWADSRGAVSIYKLTSTATEWEKVQITGLTGVGITHLFELNNEIYIYGSSYAFIDGAFVVSYKLYKSTNGIDFEEHSTFDEAPTGTVFLSGNDSYLFMGSVHSTVYRYSLEPTSIQTEQNPSSFTLLKNYPNPFNPSTTISLELAKSEQIKLEVFALNGQRIQTLANGFQKAGSHSFPFDASNLSSGVYVLRLTSESQLATHKMTLIK